MKDATKIRYYFIDDHKIYYTRLNAALEYTTTLNGKRKKIKLNYIARVNK
jgi:hypothetical protein